MNEYILKEYIIKETIGKGTFSKVKLGINKSTGEKVAIKILEKKKIRTKSDQIRVQREINIIKKIKHINIVNIIKTKEDDKNIYIIMEFIDYDLFLHIVNNKRLNEEESSLFYFQLINGVEYIHSLNIVHRDLKPENLLLTKNKILKIIDFGLSNYSFNNELLMTHCGSPSYTSPEMITKNKYDGYAVDVWTTGIILYAMLCGYLPFEDRDNKGLFKKIIKCNVYYPKIIPSNAVNLLRKILVANPDKRITIKEIKKHPFYLAGKKIFYKRYPHLISKIEKDIDRVSTSYRINMNYSFNDENIDINKNNNFNYSSSMNTIRNYENMKNFKKNIKSANLTNDNENYHISKISNSNVISTNATNNKIISIHKKLINDRKYGDNSEKRKKTRSALNEVSSSSSPFSNSLKSRINAPNFDLLKKILRGSKGNSNEKDKNCLNKINDNKEEEKKDNKKNIFSPIQLIRKINKDKQIYENRIHMTEYRDKKRFYKKKILNGINSNTTSEEEKSINFYKNIHNNSRINKSDILKRNICNKSYNNINKDITNQKSKKKMHIYNYNYNNYKNFNRQNNYNKRRNDFKNYSIFNSTNQIYKPSNLCKHHNTVVEEDKSINSFNSKKQYNNYNNNYSSFNKLKLKSINNKSIYSSKNSNTNNNSYFESYYNDNNNSGMQAYLIGRKNRIKNINKRHKKDKKINILKKRDKKTFCSNNDSLSQSKCSIVENSLSKKIISFNNLYHSIQNKLYNYRESKEKANNDDSNEENEIKPQSIILKKEFFVKPLNTNNSKNKIKNNNKKNYINSEKKRKTKIGNYDVQYKVNSIYKRSNINNNINKNINNSLKSSGDKFNNKIISVKNSITNSINNSKLNLINFDNHNSKKFGFDDVRNINYNSNTINNSMINYNMNNNKNNNNSNDVQIKTKIKKIKNKNMVYLNNFKKENKNGNNSKKFNIEEIIKRRGLDKNFVEKNKISHFLKNKK